jgi:uncharacterized membrane protein SpoIIM required for sporulation
MQYGRFVEHRREDWEALERLLQQTRSRGLSRLAYTDVERMSLLHRRAISDFAYARAHFPGTDVERRLRSLAYQGHRLLAARRERLAPRVRTFFWSGFPAVFRAAVPRLWAAVGLFALAVVLGFVMTSLQEQVAYMFLGPGLVEGLREGEIWTDSITSTTPPAMLSSHIATNNVSVAIVAWAGGALLGLGSLWVLVMNGAMLGSVVAITWQYGLADRLGDFVAAHAPLELFLILVAAAAGLGLAQGQLGRDGRREPGGFARAGRESVRLMLGTVPWFVLLGLVEGYVSPRSELPVLLKSALGFALLAAFLVYASGALGGLARRRP